jgi:hypothetical protein
VKLITVDRAVLEQALEALVARGKRGDGSPDTVAALRAALAQQEDIAQNLQSRLNAALLLEERRQEVAQPHRETEQEPTVRIKCTVVDNQHPSGVPFEQWVNAPRREWQSLTEDEIRTAYGNDLKYRDGDYERFARAIEAALKEKNNG